MTLSPETLPRHELCGLQVRVASAPNPDLVGVEGRVVRETERTLVAAARAGATERRVPKAGSVFEFALGPATLGTDEAAARREPAGTATDRSKERTGAAHVTVDGGRLLSRPARRTEDGPTPDGDDRWR
ncbi:MAG: ribonuclease P protein component 1 [Haloferacaceae archaeon]